MKRTLYLLLKMTLKVSTKKMVGNSIGKQLFLGVPANLVAFACKMSFELGYDGFAAFNAKTKLVEHYTKTLGAQLVMGNNRMVIFPMQAKILVNSYYK